jgi:Ribosomal protein L5
MAETAYVPRLRADYDKRIRGQLTEKFGYKNVMQVPRLDKVVLNMGIGEAVNDRKKAETAAADRDLDLQAAGEPADWLQGHAAQGADVRVHRQARDRGAAARARLSRIEPEEL